MGLICTGLSVARCKSTSTADGANGVVFGRAGASYEAGYFAVRRRVGLICTGLSVVRCKSPCKSTSTACDGCGDGRHPVARQNCIIINRDRTVCCVCLRGAQGGTGVAVGVGGVLCGAAAGCGCATSSFRRVQEAVKRSCNLNAARHTTEMQCVGAYHTIGKRIITLSQCGDGNGNRVAITFAVNRKDGKKGTRVAANTRLVRWQQFVDCISNLTATTWCGVGMQ